MKGRRTDEYPFCVNHTKKQYVDKRTVPSTGDDRLHPLPLLTCEGNERGNGDYFGSYRYVGSWARDVISVEKEAPKRYKKLEFNP